MTLQRLPQSYTGKKCEPEEIEDDAKAREDAHVLREQLAPDQFTCRSPPDHLRRVQRLAAVVRGMRATGFTSSGRKDTPGPAMPALGLMATDPSSGSSVGTPVIGTVMGHPEGIPE